MAVCSNSAITIALGACCAILLFVLIVMSTFMFRLLKHNRLLIRRLHYAQQGAVGVNIPMPANVPLNPGAAIRPGSAQTRQTSFEMARVPGDTPKMTSSQLKQARAQSRKIDLSSKLKENPLSDSREELTPSRRSSFGETLQSAFNNSFRKKKATLSSEGDGEMESQPTRRSFGEIVNAPAKKKIIASADDVDWPSVESDSDESQTVEMTGVEESEEVPRTSSSSSVTRTVTKRLPSTGQLWLDPTRRISAPSDSSQQQQLLTTTATAATPSLFAETDLSMAFPTGRFTLSLEDLTTTDTTDAAQTTEPSSAESKQEDKETHRIAWQPIELTPKSLSLSMSMDDGVLGFQEEE